MKKQRHIIREQVLELEFSSRTAAERWQAEAAAMARRSIVPLLDRYLDELCDPDTLIRIDTLELDIGTLDPKRLHFDLEEKMRRQLKPALKEAMRRQNRESTTRLVLLDFFITKGVLPWWADKDDPTVLETSMSHIIANNPGELEEKISTYIRHEKYLHRLIHYFSDAMLLNIVKSFSGTFHLSLEELFRDLIRVAPETSVLRKYSFKVKRQEIWKGFFYALVAFPSSKENTTSFTRQIMLHLSTAFGIPLSNLTASIKNLTKEESILGQQLEEPAIHPKKESRNLEEAPPGETPKERPITDVFSQTDELYLTNAGLAILTPYLPRFFENMYLVEKKTFIDELAPHKAMALLQFLADGSVEPPEYLLPLNKVLCGIPLETPFEAVVELDKEETEAAEAFLEAVIANAPILKNMSIDGFRNTFLRRKGILSFEDGHWMLHVERKTYDVVLDRFPWPFKIVKLPWMEYVLYVDW